MFFAVLDIRVPLQSAEQIDRHSEMLVCSLCVLFLILFMFAVQLTAE